MVSLRRRRLMGLCSGKDCFPVELPKPPETGNPADNAKQNFKPLSVHPLPIEDSSHDRPIIVPEAGLGSSNASFSSSPKEEADHYFPGKQVKRRKQHRRKHYDDQEPCIMRGVYFKNMKWQAAIKVDKKQIHLGTVGSQEEAARLYDRAAFMCGREPNFELSEEEKQELRQYTWEDFLAMTRVAINNNKKQSRRVVPVRGRNPGMHMQLQNSLKDCGNSLAAASSSVSDYGDADTSFS